MSKTKRLVARRSTAKSVLDLLDRFFRSADYGETVKLWAVLSALRGPDWSGGADRVKDFTTARIRTAAFPKTCHTDGRGLPGANTQPGPVDLSVISTELQGQRFHFESHVLRAAKALGMRAIDRDGKDFIW